VPLAIAHCWQPLLQSPTADAAFSLNRFPSRMYRRNTVMGLCPVVWAIVFLPLLGVVIIGCQIDRREEFNALGWDWMRAHPPPTRATLDPHPLH
jgi:hypothetical protein